MQGMDAFLDSSDLCRNRGVLAGKNIETEPSDRAGIRPSFSSAMTLNSSAEPARRSIRRSSMSISVIYFLVVL
jgi:hypothetical protein